MSSSNKRRKRDCHVLNRQQLYEKYIPHISQDFAKIIEDSKNGEFKQRCRELLKINDPSKVQETIATQLFKLTLGDQYNVNTVETAQENRSEESLDGTNTRSCFNDLASHIDDKQWPVFSGNISLPQEKVTEVNKITGGPPVEVLRNESSSSGNQETSTSYSSDTGKNDSTKNEQLAIGAMSTNFEDEHFKSLELHSLFDETSWEETSTECSEDQRVPSDNIKSTFSEISKCHQQFSERRDGILLSSGGDNNGNGTTLGFYQPLSKQFETRKSSVVDPSGDVGNTIKPIPLSGQALSQQLDKRIERSSVPSGDVQSTTTRPVPWYYPRELQRPDSSGADGVSATESDDSHFETLGNLF